MFKRSFFRKTIALVLGLGFLLGSPINVSAFEHIVYDDLEHYSEYYADYSKYYMDYIDISDLYIFNYIDINYERDLLLFEDELFLEMFIEMQSLMIAQIPAIDAYNALMENFFTEVNGNMELVYPDTYAGAFIDDNNILIIQLTDTSQSVIDFYLGIVGHNAPVAFKPVEFSLNQLIEFGEIFAESLGVPLAMFGFNTISNSFDIYVDQNDHSAVQMYNSFNDPFNISARFLPIPISIHLGEPMTLTSSLSGGMPITNDDPTLQGRPFTIGLSGVRPQTNANTRVLLTAGHSFRNLPLNTPVRFMGQIIGNLTAYRFGHFQAGNPGTTNGDWAVVTLNALGNSLWARFQIRDGRTINFARVNVPVNTMVTAVGAMTPFGMTGVVTQVGINIPFQNIMVAGANSVRNIGGIMPIGGDSGGPVLINDAGGLGFVGVISGAVGLGYWIFSPLLWATTHFTI